VWEEVKRLNLTESANFASRIARDIDDYSFFSLINVFFWDFKVMI
jgi:hypothetical protein